MSKAAKFKRNPNRFFADSKSRWVRLVGKQLSPLIATDGFRRLVREPWQTLAESSLPLAKDLGAKKLEQQREKRERILSAASRPLVSIVMAALDAETTIAIAIESIVAQSYENWELIVVDDGSSDETVETVEALTCDPRVSVVSAGETLGAAAARNTGLARARGRFVTFHDSDDRSHPDRLAIQLAALLPDDRLTVSLCNYQRENADREPVEINGRWVSKSIVTMMFRRERVLDRIGYLLQIPVSEDAEYYERIKAVFGPGCEVQTDRVLYFARFRRDSLLFANGDVAAVGQVIAHSPSAESVRLREAISVRTERIRTGTLDPYVGLGEQANLQ